MNHFQKTYFSPTCIARPHSQHSVCALVWQWCPTAVWARKWLAPPSVLFHWPLSAPWIMCRIVTKKIVQCLNMHNSTRSFKHTAREPKVSTWTLSISYWYHYSLLHQNGCIFFPPKVGLLHHTFHGLCKEKKSLSWFIFPLKKHTNFL